VRPALRSLGRAWPDLLKAFTLQPIEQAPIRALVHWLRTSHTRVLYGEAIALPMFHFGLSSAALSKSMEKSMESDRSNPAKMQVE